MKDITAKEVRERQDNFTQQLGDAIKAFREAYCAIESRLNEIMELKQQKNE